MPDTTITPLHWDLIIKKIHKGLCVPFLGAGVNLSRGDYRGLPLGREVALRLVKTLTGLNDEELRTLTEANIGEGLGPLVPYKDLLQLALQDLPRVALHVEIESRRDPDYFMGLLREILPDHQCEPSPLLATLARLPFRTIVTTNYDRLLERALGDKPYERVVQPIGGFDDVARVELEDRLVRSEGTIVYKIHGTFEDNGFLGGRSPAAVPSRLIITEEDYIQFLTVIGVENMGVPNLIKERLVDSTLLFLGYSLEDWDFRTLFKGMIESLPKHQQRISFAIQKDPPEFWVKYWDSKDVVIYNVDLYEFAAELEHRYQAYVEGMVGDGGRR